MSGKPDSSRKLKILVVTQYFWPEVFLINDLVRELDAQGHQVEVLTGKPNYPDGKVFPGYSAEGCTQESYAGNVVVHRVPLRPRGGGGAKNLVLNYLSFVTNGLRHFPRAVAGRRFDAILVFAPSPITSAIPAIWLKWRLRSHLSIWIQDLWPESLKATGFVKSRALLKMVGWVVKGIYACTDTLLVQSRGFVAPTARRARAERIVYYPNSYPDTNATPDDAGLPEPLRHLLEAYDCLVFAGNIGTAQAIENLLEAAAQVEDRPRFRLVVVGSGSMLAWLEAEIKRRAIGNVVLAGRFPPATMPAIFARSAGLVVTLKREEIFSYTIPSKIQAYLAAGRPIIASLDGEGAHVIEEAGAGLTCAAEDAAALAECMERLLDMPSVAREALGAAGRRYYLEHFEMSQQSRRLIEILTERVARTRGASE